MPLGPVCFEQRFRGGLVCKAPRLLYHSTLGSRVIKKKKKALCVQKQFCTAVKKQEELCCQPEHFTGVVNGFENTLLGCGTPIIALGLRLTGIVD